MMPVHFLRLVVLEPVVGVPAYQSSRTSWCIWRFLLFGAAAGSRLLLLLCLERLRMTRAILRIESGLEN